MTYHRLFEAVQSLDRISTTWLRQQATQLSNITRIHEQWSGVLDGTHLRGFYIEGPMGAPVPIGNNEALIVLSRAMCEGALGKHWRRFILTKELMHVFDEENEKTDTPEKLDHQINQFGDPTAAVTPQYNAELKALWRALGVLCTVEKRAAYKSQLIEQTISFEVVAAALRLPVLAVRLLMRDDFETLLHNSM